MQLYFKSKNNKSFYSLKEGEFMVSMFTFDAINLGKTPNHCPYYIGYTNYQKTPSSLNLRFKLIDGEQLIQISETEYFEMWNKFTTDFQNWFYETPIQYLNS